MKKNEFIYWKVKSSERLISWWGGLSLHTGT